LKVYLLPSGETEPVFLSEGPSAAQGDGEAARPRRGLRRRLEVTFRKLKHSLTRSEGGLGPRLMRVWGWLHRHIGADEPLLRGLRRAGRIEVHHPASMPSARARESWEAYLSGRFYHHLLWLTINGLLSPLSIVLMPIPGPNLVGYWFVYRAACHALALLGLRRAWGGRVETTYHPAEVLDVLLEEPDEEGLEQVAAGSSLRGLAAFLRRVRPKRPRPRDLPLARR
jgi:K+-H+ exchange-related protein